MRTEAIERQLKGAAAAVAVLLSACGGGGGGGVPVPTALPSNLSVVAPDNVEAESSVTLSSSAAATAGLRFSWQFGDGQSSDQAQAQHVYARGGDYEIVLRVSNEAGQSVEQRKRISVERTAALKGRDCVGGDGRGWCWLQGGNLLGPVSFLDSQTAWVPADAGALWKTSDGGRSWLPVVTGVTDALSQVVFGDAQRMWVRGTASDAVTVWGSQDGGKSWQSLAAPEVRLSTLTGLQSVALVGLGGEKLQLSYVYQPGMRTLYYQERSNDGAKTWQAAAGVEGLAGPAGTRWKFHGDLRGLLQLSFGSQPYGDLERSSDGGASWQPALALGDSRAGEISFAGGSTVFVESWEHKRSIVRTLPSPRRYHVSQDLGRTWTEFDAPALAESFNGVSLLSAAGALWASADGVVYRSSDFGRHWAKAELPAGMSGAFPTRLELGALWLSNGVAAYFSADEGQTWAAATMPGDAGALVHQTGPQQLLAELPNGAGLRLSTDGGRSWVASVSPSGKAVPVSGFLALSPTRWLKLEQTLQLSTDAGRSWQGSSLNLRLDALDAHLRMAASGADSGWLKSVNGVYRYRNAGTDWELLGRPTGIEYWNLCDLDFEGRDIAMWLDADGNLHQSQDGGANWNKLAALGKDDYPSCASAGVQVLSLGAGQWLIAQRDRLLRSSDGGKSWTAVLSSPKLGFANLAKAGDQAVWAIGADNQVWRSSDKGQQWQRVALQAPANTLWRAVHFLDAQQGWLARDGVLLATTDGGSTWTVQKTASSMKVSGIQAWDAKTVWFWGDRGLQGTGTGGR